MKLINLFQLSVFSLLFACSTKPSEPTKIKEKNNKIPLLGDSILKVKKANDSISSLSIKGKDTLVPVNHFNSNIYFDLKYATSDNFMHRILYDTLKVAYVQIEVARRLAAAQTFLTKKNPTLHLLIYDALRPVSVQQEMWNALDTIPVRERTKFVSNPANGSIHNYGAAVDVTICSSKNAPLDMGAKYDEIEKIAYPSLESVFLKEGKLTEKQIQNRQLLRLVMSNQGFRNIPTEWWHFNAFSRVIAKQNYSIVTNENVQF